jgi:chromosome segregation ATPase
MSADKQGNRMDDVGEDGRWLTYDELAKARGIDRQSARRMANRSRWRRQKDNHGVVRIYVPMAQAIRQRRQQDVPAGISADKPAAKSAGTSADIRQAIGALEAAVVAFRERAEADADIVAGLQAEIGALRQASADNRATEATLRAQLAATTEVADQSQRQAQAAQDATDADRRAAQARADAAEDRAQRAEDRTTELRDRLGTTQAELAAARESEDRARAQAHAAQDEAAALRQAADVQRALGRWARLRRAWWGSK